MYIHAYIYTHVCMYIYIYMYICMYEYMPVEVVHMRG